MEYHLWLGGEARGPFTLGQVRAMWNGGKLTAQDLFSRSGGQEWHYLGDILEELEPPKPVIVPSRSPEELEVLKKIEKAQTETKKNTGCVRSAVAGVGLIILAIIFFYVLLIAGQNSRGVYTSPPDTNAPAGN